MFFSFYFLDFFGSNFFVIIPKPKTVYIIPTKAPTNGIIVNSHITREVANNIPIFGHVLDIFNLVHIMLFSAIVNTGILKSNNTIYVKSNTIDIGLVIFKKINAAATTGITIRLNIPNPIDEPILFVNKEFVSSINLGESHLNNP